MSRIGKKPVIIPAGVTVSVADAAVTVKGAKGTLSQVIDDPSNITVKVMGNEVIVERANDEKEVRAKHGLYRALIANMVKGVTEGYQRGLLVNGIGYKVAVQGQKLTLNIGFSHPIEFVAPDGIKIECPSQNEITILGIDKTLVGQVAATIRAMKKPEPYHGYGIQYKDEIVERKEGKAAGKK